MEPRLQVDMEHCVKLASRCRMEHCMEPSWQVDVVWALCGAKVASRYCMEHCVEPRCQVDVA